jgi:membrane protein YfhO
VRNVTSADFKPGRLGVWLLRIMVVLGLLFLIGSTGLFKTGYYAVLRSLAAAAGKPEPAMAFRAAAWSLHQADLLRIGLVLLAAAGLILLARRSVSFRTRWLAWGFCLLLVVDMVAVDQRITHPEKSLRELARTNTGGVTMVAAADLVRNYDPSDGDNIDSPFFKQISGELGHERLWPLGNEAMRNNGMTAGIRSLGGYHPAKPAAFETVRQRLNRPDQSTVRIASWLGARLIWNGEEVFNNPEALPRARLVDDWRLSAEDLPGYLNGLQGGTIDPARQVTLDVRPDPVPQTGSTPLPPVDYLFDGMNRVELTTTADRPAVLVLADNWLPGWTVRVDDQPAELLLADYMLRGVALAAGTHRVEFAYHVPYLDKALVISGLGVLMALLLLFADRYYSQKRHDHRRRADQEALRT